MIVVSDTSPINYLILIEQINLLPELFGEIIIPQIAIYLSKSTKFIYEEIWPSYRQSAKHFYGI